MSGIANWQAQIRIDIEDLKKRIKVAEGEINNFTNEDRKVKLDIDTKTLESAIQKLDKMLDSLGKGTGDFKQFENLSKELLSIVSEVKSLSKAFGKVDDSGAKILLSSIQNIDKSLSELNQNILNVNKNMSNMGGNTSGAVKQVENISNAYQDAAKEAEKLSDAQSKIGQKTNISSKKKYAFPDKDISASVESATNSIKEENNVLEQNTQKVKENTQAKEQNANANLNKYDKRLDSYNGKIDKYKTTIDRFNDGGWTSNTYLENVQAVKNAVHEYETLLNELKGKDASLVTSDDISKLDEYEKKIKDTIATVTNMSASEKGYNFVSGQKELDKIHKLLNENSKMSSEAKAKIKAYYAEIESGNPSMSLDKIHGEILKIYNAEVEAGRAGRTLWDTLKNSGFHQLAAQMAGMFGFYDFINLGKEGLSVVRELNTALTEMRKVSDESLQSLKNYQNTTFDVADAVGTTAKQIQTSTADYMRLGESLDEAAESAKTANVLLNVSEFDNIEDATKSLVAMGQAYKDLDKMTIVDKLNEVGKIVAQTYSNVWCYKNIAW
jgi:predicted  nucleic acid-binding Zn-ribbon protein